MNFQITNEDPNKWSVDEVYGWIQTLGIRPDVASRFREAGIDGQKLMDVNYSFLKEHMNIENHYDQFNIVMSIALLRRTVKYGDNSKHMEQLRERVNEKKQNYGYMKKWLHMEQDELLLPYGESDPEQNYISSDFEEDMNREEEECLRKGKPSLFIDVDSIEHKNRAQDIIDQYIDIVHQNWKLERFPKLEERRWWHWTRLLPPRKHVNPREVIHSLEKDCFHLKSKRLPELIEEIKPNIISRVHLDRIAKQRCGNLDSTLHEIYETEWKIELVKGGKVPERPSKRTRDQEDDIQRNSEIRDDAFIREDEEDSDYESDFIDDSNVEYTPEELAEFERIGMKLQFVSISNETSCEEKFQVSSPKLSQEPSQATSPEPSRAASSEPYIPKELEFGYTEEEMPDVIKLRKDRALLEKEFTRRYVMQRKSTKREKGIIINLGHKEDEVHIYIHEGLASKLKRHQIEGVRFLWKNIIMFNKGCVLAHSMGLGKTFQKILICNWEEEFKKWIKQIDVSNTCPVYKFRDDHDTKERRISLLEKWWKGGILLMGYEMFHTVVNSDSRYSEFLLKPGPSLVVADEGHKLRNKDTGLYRDLVRLRTPSRIILTGSPLQNNLEEYWCTIDFACPNFLGKFENFRKVYIAPIEEGLYKQVSSSKEKTSRKTLFVLSRVIEDIMHRRSGTILEQELKPKHDFYIAFMLTPEQLDIYRDIIGYIKKENLTPVQYDHLLSNLCNHPKIMLDSVFKKEKQKSGKMKGQVLYIDLTNESDTDQGAEDKSQSIAPNIREFIIENMAGPIDKLHPLSSSGKMVLLKEILIQCKKINDKVLIFSKSIPTINFIQKMITQEKISGQDIRIVGDTNSSSRQELIDRFNKSEEWRVALISIKTGAVGVNLFGANRVILFDGDWNPSVAEQAIGRAYRYGQKKEVYVYRFVTYGTFEEKLFAHNIHKTGLSLRVLDQKNPTKNFSKDEMNTRYLSIPPSYVERRLPLKLNFNDQLLERVSNLHSKHIFEINPMKRYFLDDKNELDEEELQQCESMVKNEKLGLSMII
ncbi:15682_t:CDS:2 [Acaulospora colombiana]|uniref:15682_t:CDS:1 n=1 Tax=Acaulospora colombiana TaxID=27376 RepID=A0ACA9K607_9GLOM|nr:15682_t:CDS:2 [Acaulospora colombiana]